jgi:DNA-binding HxlR family transcriptional regulator
MVTSKSRYKNRDPYNCPMTLAIEKIGGRWKPIILFYLTNGRRRFGQLAATVPKISKKVLTQQLKILERDGLITRKPSLIASRTVEYALTDLGMSAVPLLQEICDWGQSHVSIKIQEASTALVS